uniref:Serine/threonine-protein kinase RIO2 n=1 Tax=Kwoniella dejecticola CBS 10117 TaxID=1296121 RepID=A0A1A5ZW51_9TREE|nr:Atypical/RIO/RIO2 protein kinase [Kwoniella dejecticola CBS 10117]OBR82038.1 Atypical/RIO/RIO2 protein kinase [Kwoniella dejecticola CBS 10117]
MKLDATDLRYVSADEFRVLSAVEIGSKNHEVVPTSLIAELSGIRGGNVNKALGELAKRNLVGRVQNIKYDGYRLTYGGLDYLALRTFSRRKLPSIHSVGTRVGVGKESDIMIVADESGEKRILKMHRLGRISFRAIKSKRDYLGKRRSASWMYMSRLSAQKEFAFMKALYEHDFPVPVPIDQARHCVVMSLIDGYPLRAIEQCEDPADLYSKLMELIVRLAHAGLIHGDFNEFNIMITRKTGEPIVIDFPQMVSTRHENAEYFFNRDVNCIRRFFRRRFRYESLAWPTWKDVLEGEEGEDLPTEVSEKSDANQAESSTTAQKRLRIDLEVEASGFGRALQRELEDYMLEVQDLPPSDDEDEETEEDDEDDDEDQEAEEGVHDDPAEAPKDEPFDETAFQEQMAARLEAVRIHKALGNDVDSDGEPVDPATEDLLSSSEEEEEEDSDADSNDSVGPAQSDYTSYMPSQRNTPRHHDRISVNKIKDKKTGQNLLKETVARQVSKQREMTERKHHSKSGISSAGKRKGSKWKNSDKYATGKDSGW